MDAVLSGKRKKLLAVLRGQLLQAGEVGGVGGVAGDDQRAGDVLHTLQDHLVFVGPLGTVDDENHHVDVFQRRRSGLVRFCDAGEQPQHRSIHVAPLSRP